MSGELLTKARLDARKIMMGEFSEDILLSTPDGSLAITSKGLASKHHVNFDTDGLPVNSKNAHICLDENDLASKGYVVRDSQSEVNLINHRVDVKDSTGLIKKYVIKETFPDETLGMITCILGDFE